MKGYFEQLRRAHRLLTAAIGRESKRPGRDPYLLTELKKRRLAVKDRMTALLNGALAARRRATRGPVRTA